MDYRKLTSPCGIDCFNCELYRDNVTPEMQAFVGKHIGLPAEEVVCEGCRLSGCIITRGKCECLECVGSHGVEFCHECEEFPCNILQPCFDKAQNYPQNFKLFNLLRMKKVGLETWAREESKQIRRRYKEGILYIGSGPLLPEEVKKKK